MISRTRKSLITHFGHFSGHLFRGIAVAAMASALLLTTSTPSKALTFNWSFKTSGASDDPDKTISGLIWGLQEGFNNGSDVHATVTSTPTDDLEGGVWDFYTTMPPSGIAFVVSGGVLTYANAGFILGGLSLGGPQLIFSINNDANDYSYPLLGHPDEDIWWHAGLDDTTTFTPKAYYELKLKVPYMLMATAIDPDSPNYDPRYSEFLAAAKANEAAMSFAAAPEVPIPAALPLLAAGLGALGFAGWRKKQKAGLAA